MTSNDNATPRLLTKLIRFLINNQLIVTGNLLTTLITFPLQYLRAVSMDVKKVLRRGLRVFRDTNQSIKNAIESKKEQAPVDSDMLHTLQQSDFSEDDVKITFLAAARRKNNPNCSLEGFLKSVIQHCDNINQVEVLLAVDPDDYLSYFLHLKQLYQSKLRFRVFVTEKRLGYENLHLYDTFLFKHIAKSTRMLCDYSDDCKIISPHFDKQLLAIDALYPDNIYFIHTQKNSREDYLGDVSKNIEVLYWALQAKAPASYFPIFSRQVLQIAADYAAIHDTQNEWSPIANTWICDCYIDIISTQVKALGADRIHCLDLVKMNSTILASYQKADKVTQLTPNNRAFIKMLNQHTLQYIAGLSQTIRSHITTRDTLA
jgi:hypothetical protein